MLPFVHADVMHTTIQLSELFTLEDSGHEIHYAEWDWIVTAILNHTAGAFTVKS